jgi:hypothetical protein
MNKILVAVFTASILILGSGTYMVSAPTQGNDFHAGDTLNNQDIEIYEGVLRPCTDAGISLGDSSHEFNNLRIDGTATMDAVTIDETLGVTGAVTLTSDITVGGVIISPVLTINVTSTTANQTVSSNFIIAQGTGTLDLYTSRVESPLLSTQTTTAGTYVVMMNTSTSKDLYFSTGAASCIIAPTEFILGANDVVTMMFNGTYWVVISTVSN